MAVVHTWTSRTLDADELADLYEWLDRVPLSKPRSNVEKDFSDGILAAEIVRFYYPDIVDFRMLRPALSIADRTEQWKLINSEIFNAIGLTVPSHVLAQLSISKSGIAQSFLFNLRMSLALTGAQTNLFPPPQFLQDPRLNGMAYPIHPQAHVGMGMNGMNPYQHMYNPLWAMHGQKGGPMGPFMQQNNNEEEGKGGKNGKSPSTNGGGSSSRKTLGSSTDKGGNASKVNGMGPFVPYPAAISSVSLNQAKSELNDKNKKLQDKEEEVNDLKAQMKRMDEMVKLKNSKIQDLTSQVEKMNNGKKTEVKAINKTGSIKKNVI